MATADLIYFNNDDEYIKKVHTMRKKNQRESDPAKSVRIMKAAMLKDGGKSYFNAVELQSAQRNMDIHRKETIKLVEDN